MSDTGYKSRAAIFALPGGDAICNALDDIVGRLNTQPVRIGAIYVRSGKGSPLNVVNGSVGDIYLRQDGGTTTTLYVKEGGAANTSTGWTAK